MAAGLALVWAAPEQDKPAGSPKGDETRRSGNGHPAPWTILGVEDEVLTRLAVCDFLRESGYRVLKAGTGEEAQAIVESGEPIEVLYSDIDLGSGMNGFMLATWVRANYPTVQIVLASGVTRMPKEAGPLCDVSLADHIKRLWGPFGRQTG
jgi:CheY-like chemotaxis protein